MISIETAYDIRFERGLLLPINKEYVNKRLLEIAMRQEKLMSEMDELDEEIIKMYEQIRKT
jgi:hypothetical protein